MRVNEKIKRITPDTLICGIDIGKTKCCARFCDFRGLEVYHKVWFDRTENLDAIGCHITAAMYKENTGIFSFVGKHNNAYSECYSDLVGKYIYSSSASSNNISNLSKTSTTIYKIMSATESSIKYVKVYPKTDEVAFARKNIM